MKLSKQEMILIDLNTGGKVRNLIVLFFRFWGGQISTLTPGQILMLIDTKVTEWRSRPLDICYPIAYLDGISVKVSQILAQPLGEYSNHLPILRSD